MSAATRSQQQGQGRRGARQAALSLRHGGVQVAEVQRSRILGAAVAVVSKYGYPKMTVSRVTGRAGVSRRTFYDLFEDRDDCFLAVFDDAVARASEVFVNAYEAGGRSWLERVRAGLVALLGFFDEQPAVCSLLVVDGLKAGPVVQRRRAEILGQLASALQEDGSQAGSGRELPPLTGEGAVGAVLGVVHTRLTSGQSDRMSDLVSSLMAMIVLPYLGPAAAQREMDRPAAKIVGASKRRGRRSSSSSPPAASDLFHDLPMRLTYRTLRVLSAISEQPGASNRLIGEMAGASDQGQISRLLARLEKLGLVENSGQGQAYGECNAWRLTELGSEVQEATVVAGGVISDRPSRGSQRDRQKERVA
jgi:AcrR family transcriptional regulator/DNA-binding MarR family transcriptional regulator